MSIIDNDTPTMPRGPKFALWTTISHFRDPYTLHRSLVEKFGDPVAVTTVYGRALLSGRADVVKQILGDSSDNFGPAVLDNLLDFVPPKSMQLMDGMAHTRERKLINPLLARSRMRALAPMIREICARHLGGACDGQALVARELTSEITLEHILRSLFGANDVEQQEELRRLVLDFTRAIGPAIVAFPRLRKRFGGRGPWSRFTNARAALHNNLENAIQQAKIGGRSVKTDLLCRLVQSRYEDGSAMPNDAIRDELITMLFAGHEATSTAMAWSLYWMNHCPETYERLATELRGAEVDDDGVLKGDTPYAEAFCSEVLRLNPIAPEITRQSRREVTIAGYRIPKGTVVLLSPYLLHSDPESYPDPFRFDPTRFLGIRPSPHRFLAFGGGVHRCIGAAFALFEMKYFLLEVIRNFKVTLCEPGAIRAVRTHHILGPEGGVKIRIERQTTPHCRNEHCHVATSPHPN